MAFRKRVNEVRISILVLVGVVALLQFGCDSLYNQRFQDPLEEFDLRKQRVLVVGFREGKGWYGDSINGRELQRWIHNYLQQECDNTELAADEAAEAAAAKDYDCVADTVPWSQIAAEADVDRIIYGEIRTLVFEQPKMIGMFMGHLDLVVKVWDAEEDRTVSWQKTFRFPQDPEQGEVMPSFEMNEQEVRNKLYRIACEEITLDFCGKLVPIFR